MLKTVWAEEISGGLNDLRRQMNRQVFSDGKHIFGPSYAQIPIRVEMTPAAIRARKQRQLEMMQLVARTKRGNKPSYRQRQKNARAARG